MPYFSFKPDRYLPVVKPSRPICPGDRLTGYMIYEEPNTLFIRPSLERPLQTWAIVFVFVSALFFRPVAVIPFFCGCAYNGYQIPIYTSNERYTTY